MTPLLDPVYHPIVLDILRESARVEIEARGGERRRTFRITRHLLAGAMALGVPAASIALELGVRPDSVRARAGTASRGPVGPSEFAARAGVPLSRVLSWDLPPSPEETGARCAIDLLDAVIRDVMNPQRHERDGRAGEDAVTGAVT